MNRAFAYRFTSSLTLEEMRPRLEQAVPWTWYARDNDRWGDYISAAPVSGMQVKLLYDPDGGYGLDLKYQSEEPDAQAQLETVLETVRSKVLPALEAEEMRSADSYE